MTAGGSSTSAASVVLSSSASSASSTRWERSPEVLWRRTSTGVVVLPVDSSAAVTLEGVHAALWEAMARPVTISGLVDPLAAFLPDDPETAVLVLSEAIRFMVATGAVRESVEP